MTAKAKLIPAGVPWAMIPWEAIEDSNLDPYEFRVYAYLMRRADSSTGLSMPSQRTISTATGVSKNKVNKAIQKLIGEKWITVEDRRDSVDPRHEQRLVYRVWGTRPARLWDENRPTGETGSDVDRPTAGDGSDPARPTTETVPPERPVSTEVQTVPPEGTEPSHGKGHIKNPYQEPIKKPAVAEATTPRIALKNMICELFGTPASNNEWGKVEKVAKILDDADVTPMELADLTAAYLAKYEKPNEPAPQPTAMTIATRVGELRHFLQRGPLRSPGGSMQEALEDRARDDLAARLDAEVAAGQIGGAA